MNTNKLNPGSALEYLEGRGSLEDCTHKEDLEKSLTEGPITFYCGFDPTGRSLHAGSLVPLMAMKRLMDRGHKGLALIGTATGMIGDPSGKSAERVLQTEDVIIENSKCLEENIRSFFESCGISSDQYKIVKNHDWLQGISYMNFLRDVGKMFSVNLMISKESVKERLNAREQGISYTEFSYMLLQAYDFLHLYKTYNCRLQVGGSDQWGNITAGLDLIKKSVPNGTPAFGATFPLLTTAEGKKFGKTEAGAIYISSEATSPLSFHQFWLNSSDADVVKYLKLFTDLDSSTIESLEQSVKSSPEKREAQKALADTMTKTIHGEQGLQSANNAQKALFAKSGEKLSLNEILAIAETLPNKLIKKSELEGKNIQDLMVILEAAASKGAGKKLIDGGGVSINGEKIENAFSPLSKDLFLEDQVLLLKVGKKSHYVLKLEAGA